LFDAKLVFSVLCIFTFFALYMSKPPCLIKKDEEGKDIIDWKMFWLIYFCIILIFLNIFLIILIIKNIFSI
jgi:hypothetical protein